MRTVLAISDSVENTQFDLSRSIATLKDLALDPLVVVPTFFRSDNSSDSFDVTENIDYVFSECEFSSIKVGYLTNSDVLNYLCGKLGTNRREDLFVEPSLISDTGDILVGPEVYEIVCSKLAPIAKMIIVNSFEAELLAEFECNDASAYLRASKKIFNTYGCLVLIKACDRTEGKTILFDGFKASFILPKQVKDGFDSNTYNLATAVVSFFVKNNDIVSAVDSALEFCSGIYVEEPEEIIFPSKDDLTIPSSEEAADEVMTVSSKETIEEVIVEEAVVTEPVTAEAVTEVNEVKSETIPEPKKPLIIPEFKRHSFSMPKTTVPKLSLSIDNTAEIKEEKPEVTVPSSNTEPKVPVVESTSLVSPSKPIRELLRTMDKETPDVEPAVTTSIEKPAPGSLGTVSDLATPGFRLKNEVSNSILDLESLRNRLNSLTGSENK